MQDRRAKDGQTVFNLRTMYKSGPRLIRSNAKKARALVHELIRRGYVRMQGSDYEMRPEELL